MNLVTPNDASLFESFINKNFDYGTSLFQLERFGNNAINNYPHANRVNEVVQTLPPEVVSKITESVAKSLNENDFSTSSYPQLSPPKNDLVRQKGGGML